MAKKEESKRLLVFEPNLEDNKIFPTEDLGIIVELKTTKKSRSVLSLDGGIENTDGGGKINFIAGSKDNSGTHLTTNYTNATVNFNEKDSNRDLETLGIENIQINFDTAYTPKININFVDIRGNAVFQQGQKSKYGVFFDLPYPIFELTVKGFYGKPVTYCLHLLKWNSNFNSSTGNFEIKTEFIGYTYAILTDMLLGFMRAVINTPEGKPFWQEAVQEYKNANPPVVLKSIDQFIADIQNLAIEFDKIKNNDDNLTKINDAKVGEKVISDIEAKLDFLIKTIIPDYTNYFNSHNEVIGIPEDKNNAIDGHIERYKEGVKELLNNEETGYNKLVSADLQIDEELITSIINFKVLEKFTKDGEDLGIYIQKNVPEYNANGTELTHENKHLGEEIVANLPRNISSGITIEIFDLRKINTEIKRVSDNYKKSNSKLTKKLGKELAEKSKETLGFDSTIKNVIRILTTHCEVFLKTLQSVSQEAEKSSERAKIIREQVLTSGKINSKREDKDKKIFPWPEYRKQKPSKKGGIQEEESWMGDEINHRDFDKIPELKFVENLYEALLNVARGDENLINTNIATQKQFYPVGPSDAMRINDKMIDNPYKIALTESKSKTIYEEAIRCFFIRAFTLLGVNSRAPLYDKNIALSGEFEAENLYSVLTDGNAISKDKADEIIGNIQNINDFTSLIKLFSETGVNNLNNPGGKSGPTKLFKKITESNKSFYRYDYIKSSDVSNLNSVTPFGRCILPLNGNFDGEIFFDKNNNNEMLGGAELIDLSNDGVYFTTSFSRGIGNFKEYEDGSKNLIIHAEDNYKSHTETPDYGLQKLNDYLKLTTELGGLGSTHIDQQSIKRSMYDEKDGKLIPMDGFNLKNGTYLTPEINDIIYNSDAGVKKQEQKHFEKFDENDKNKSSVLCNYFYRNDTFGGNFLRLKLFHGKDANLDVNGNTTAPEHKKIKRAGTGFSGSNPPTDFSKWKKDYDIEWGHEIIPNDRSAEYRVDNDIKLTSPRGSENYFRHTRYPPPHELLGILLGENSSPKNSKGTEIKSDEIYTPYINFGVYGNFQFSLFGSRWYYEQRTNEARAFLFLHTFSWNGLIGDHAETTYEKNDVSLFNLIEADGDSFSAEDGTPTIKGLFANNATFLKAPKLWCAFIGGLLYRLTQKDTGQDDSFIRFYDYGGGTFTPFLPGLNNNQTVISSWPKRNQYLYNNSYTLQPHKAMGISLDINEDIEDNIYVGVDKALINLPKSVKREFISVFEDFVEKEFKDLRKEFELFYTKDPSDFNFTKWKQLWNTFHSGVSWKSGNFGNEPIATTELVEDTFKETTHEPQTVLKNYANVGVAKYFQSKSNSPSSSNPRYIFNTGNPYQFQLVNKFGGNGVAIINKLYKTSYYIQNCKPEIFIDENKIGYDYNNFAFTPIQIRTNDLELYTGAFLKRFKDLSKDWYKERGNIEDELEQRVFNSTDDTIIKLNLYRTLSSINSKWITSDENVFNPSSCGCNGKDENIARDEGRNKPRLIDSFRFVDRAYNDIGEEFYINPIVVSNMIIGKYNSSFFNLLNKILRNNNFTFISLPTFINYNSLKEVGEVFKPYPYKSDISGSNGPSFICTYVGQTSTNLDLGAESTYPDDGIEVLKDDNNNLIGLPEDFNNNKDSDKSLNIPFFLVSYARQNQSFFKNIKLDQTEYSETAESLSIIEDLSQGAKTSSPAHIGQNLWNVYQKRAYTCEIEMMGNAMIQPMMYFHLDDIPMFKGAYNIYKVNHVITPHNMTTKFTGTRIKRAKTALIEKSELFGNLLSELITGNSKTKPFGTQDKKKRNARLDELGTTNPPDPKNFIDTPITMKLLPVDDSISRDTKADISDGFKLQKAEVKIFALREVAELLQKSFKEFNEQAKDKDFNNVLYLNDISFNGGGITSEHASHQIGRDIDLRQITSVKGSKASGIYFDSDFFNRNSSAAPGASPKLVPYKKGLNLINPEGDNRKSFDNYSREGTSLFISILKKYSGTEILNEKGEKIFNEKTKKALKYPKIDIIFFNDPKLIEQYSFVKPLKAHSNHLHIRFTIPERIEEDLKIDGVNSRAFKGSVQK